MIQPPLVSVVILNYNGRKFIDIVFPSVLRSTYQNIEVIMVDNASTDESVSLARAKFPQVKIILSDKNLGYTGGNNLGIRAALGKYIVLLNNDVEVEHDWLDHLVKKAESDESIGALQPKLQSMINKGFFEYAGASGGFIDRWGYPFLRGRIFETIEKDEGLYDDEREIFWASGAAVFLRKSALDKVGDLDEDYFMHFEEIDLCWRLHSAGYKIFVVPASLVYHYVSASLPATTFSKLYWNHRNNLITLVKNLPAKKFWRTLALRWLMDGVAAVHGILKGQPARLPAVLKAHFWIYLNIFRLAAKRRELKKRMIQPASDFKHLIYPKSIVVDYFLKKKHHFSTLKF